MMWQGGVLRSNYGYCLSCRFFKLILAIIFCPLMCLTVNGPSCHQSLGQHANMTWYSKALTFFDSLSNWVLLIEAWLCKDTVWPSCWSKVKKIILADENTQKTLQLECDVLHEELNWVRSPCLYHQTEKDFWMLIQMVQRKLISWWLSWWFAFLCHYVCFKDEAHLDCVTLLCFTLFSFIDLL